MRLSEITFRETCCGGHTKTAEVFREDGVGFLIKQSPETGLYDLQVFEPDRRTLRTHAVDVGADEADLLLST